MDENSTKDPTTNKEQEDPTTTEKDKQKNAKEEDTTEENKKKPTPKDTKEEKKEDPPKDPEYISTIDFVIRDLMKKFGSVFSDGSHVVDGIRAGFKEPQRYFRKDGNLNDRTYYDEMIKTIRASIDEIAKNPLNLPSQVKLEGVSQEELDNFMKTYGKMPLPLGSSSSPEHPHIKYCDDPEKKKKDKAATPDAEADANAGTDADNKPNDKLETNTGTKTGTNAETENNAKKANSETTSKAETDSQGGGQGYKKRHSRKKRKKRKQRQSKRRLTQTHAD